MLQIYILAALIAPLMIGSRVVMSGKFCTQYVQRFSDLSAPAGFLFSAQFFTPTHLLIIIQNYQFQLYHIKNNQST